jgi:SAM-dependent methyltransferase
MTDKYLFGDTDLAARRLEVLAGVFAASSRAFLTEATDTRLHLAVDLGCGPGYTTRLLADVLECEQTIGLDNSEHFIALAERTATDKVSFRLHDVTAMPFPVEPCDAIYARFLLTHQRDPEALIAKWATQLSSGGRLLLEEVDSIHTETAAFVEYLRIVEAMLTDGGGELYLGPPLGAMSDPPGLVRRSIRLAPSPVTTDLAAKMFSMNIQTWKHNAFVKENYSRESIERLEQALTDLAATPTNDKSIEWRLRQIAYERET